MEKKLFERIKNILAIVILVLSSCVYLSTIEPTASFWDCGEFIASSYKLEVGHPPGNPMFQLIARFFTMFTGPEHAAAAVNCCSAMCSAFTIFFLFLTIVHFGRRLLARRGKALTNGAAIAVLGAGAAGALAYCFSDTFWFSAVEGEVYAMSSLVTAIVFWAILKWEEHYGEPYNDRWLVFIALMLGLSIGIHLLSLLVIPVIVFIYYYKSHEGEKMTFWKGVLMLAVSALVLALILFIIIPWVPRVIAGFDRFFVNSLGAPFNLGASILALLLFAACFALLRYFRRREKAVAHTMTLAFTAILIGYSVFAVVVIRANANPPTNEYSPDNPYTLVRYINREQYGSKPVVFGESYKSIYDIKDGTYWTKLDDRYYKTAKPLEADYPMGAKMLFPRMWSTSPDGKYEKFYRAYTGGKGTQVRGATDRKPTMAANLYYFFDYQLGWMYWRYFMWNFVGRQNEIHSPTPGDIFHGNWESGVKFIDDFRLGDQSDAPATLAHNAGKNHYFFLPLLLGLIGLCFQFDRDKRGSWLTFLMFFMTGIAIVLYLNQPPYQVRERDYAYAGSFYFFSVWIGLAVAAVYSWISSAAKGRQDVLLASAVTAACVLVPVQMATQNWDDHDRSGRATAVEMARNYLESVGPNGILITHGDNDTFPVWYAQEVENIRTDVRICNTSLLGTDWHIDQMKWACNESAPLDLSIGPEQYLYGTNEYIPILDTREQAMNIADVVTLFRHPEVRVPMSSGRKVDYIASRRLVVPVNKANVIASGILDAKYADMIPESIELQIPKGKDYLTKPELFMLDLLSNYQWDRPINMLNMGGDLNIGLKDYLVYEGYSYKFVPIKNKITTTDIGFVDTEELYRKMTKVYSWDALAADKWFVDYQNIYTHLGVMAPRGIFLNAAKAFMKEGKNEWAVEMLDRCQEVMHRFPLESIPLGMSTNDYLVIGIVEAYYQLGELDKARELGALMAADLLETTRFYLEFFEFGKNEFDLCGSYVYYLADVMKSGGDKDVADKFTDGFSKLIDWAAGKEEEE